MGKKAVAAPSSLGEALSKQWTRFEQRLQPRRAHSILVSLPPDRQSHPLSPHPLAMDNSSHPRPSASGLW